MGTAVPVAEQLALLRRFTEVLASASSVEELVSVLFDRAQRTLGTVAGALLDLDGETLKVTGSFGYPPEIVETWGEVPLSAPLPAPEAVRTGEPVVIGTRAEYEQRFPSATGIVADEGAVLAIPLTDDGRPVGSLGLRFPTARQFSDDDIEVLVAAAQQFTLARSRLALLDGERSARADAEKANGRLTFLASASREIATSLDYERTLSAVARMAVPGLADWCAVDLLDDDGELRQLAVAHVDPDKVTMAQELRRRYPPDPDAPYGLPAAIRSGRSELIEEIPRELLEEAVADKPELRALLDELQLRSSMVVPMVLHGEAIGAISFVMAESGRRYTPLDLQLAEELAARAAIAIGNARLYGAEQRARSAAEEARSRTEMLVELGDRLTSSPELQSAAAAFARFLADEQGDGVTVCLLDRDGIASLTAHARTQDRKVCDASQRGIAPLDDDDPDDPVNRAVLDRVAVTGRSPDDAWIPRWLGSDRVWHSAVVVPIASGARTLGAVVIGREEDRAPFSPDEHRFIDDLADRAAQALDNARLYSEQRFIADTLQTSLLPPSVPHVPGYDIAFAYRPAGDGRQVGGDFYDVVDMDTSVILVVGDVSGKGSRAAAVMALSRYAIRTAALRSTRPSEMLETVNESLMRQPAHDRFTTAAVVRLASMDGRMTAAVAGHPLPIVVRADGAVERIGRPGSLLGVFPDPTLHDVGGHLHPGDLLILYTDGLTDARRGDDRFGEERLVEVLSLRSDGPEEVVGRAMEAVTTFAADDLSDDIALLVARRR